MENFDITTGDFLKNAGIVGMWDMLEISAARKDIDYGISKDEQTLWIAKDFAIEADWTDMYFKAFVAGLGPFTVYEGVLERIQNCIQKIESEEWKPGKETKDDLKFINDKLLSNSYQSGFENIKDRIKETDIYLKLKKDKLSDKLEQQELKIRLQNLQKFLIQPLCKETFTMKSIIYTYINRFWDGKSFLNRANAKKDMRGLFEKEFSKPLREYWMKDHKKAKDLCVDCGMPMDSKEKVSIAFMKDMADDLSRKKSAFWNCKVDAYLCPVCAYVYALSPLGFQVYINKFVFMNVNESVSSLISANRRNSQNVRSSEKNDEEKYSVWFSRNLNIILSEKKKEISNIQVILRGREAEDKYICSNIGKEALSILEKEKVSNALDQLAKHPFIKVKGDFLNVHEAVVMNILNYQNQYTLLNRLMKEAIENEGILFEAYWVYVIQVWARLVRCGKDKERDITMRQRMMRKNGYNLRKAIMEAKGVTKDDCLRGTIYQLLNALSVRDTGKFIDIVVRLYSSTKLLMPNGFVDMLDGQESFLELGYAFVLGLKGSYWNKKSEDEKEEEL